MWGVGVVGLARVAVFMVALLWGLERELAVERAPVHRMGEPRAVTRAGSGAVSRCNRLAVPHVHMSFRVLSVAPSLLERLQYLVAANPLPDDVSMPRLLFLTKREGSPPVRRPSHLKDARLPLHALDSQAGAEAPPGVQVVDKLPYGDLEQALLPRGEP